MVRLYVYSTSEHTIGAWLQYSDTSADHSNIIFKNHNDMIAFILHMGIGTVGIVTSRQAMLAYGIRLDTQSIETSLSIAQAVRKGRNKKITVYNSALQSPI